MLVWDKCPLCGGYPHFEVSFLSEVPTVFASQETAAGEEKEDKRHDEIKEMLEKLFYKLDTLSNLHFTPKPVSTDRQNLI